LVLGFALGVFGVAWAYWLQHNFWVALTVGLALIINALITTFLGAFWPLLFQRWGFDPALVSGPLISTAMDVFGLLVYFEIATLLLPWVLGIGP